MTSPESIISSLEARIKQTEQELEDMAEENEELEEKINKQLYELSIARSDYSSLNSRYQVLLKAAVKFTRSKQ